jgi:hypothetical protein
MYESSGWYKPVIPALRKLKQEDCKFKANLGNIGRSRFKKKKKKKGVTRHQWLMSEILATPEAEIRKITVQGLRPAMANSS